MTTIEQLLIYGAFAIIFLRFAEDSLVKGKRLRYIAELAAGYLYCLTFAVIIVMEFLF